MRAWRILILNMFNSMTKTTLTTKAEATRDRIVDVALDLFRRQGFEQTTMREIAAKAGVSLGSAYYYFESKEDLVMAFYERAMEAMAPRIEAALKSAVKFEKRLEAILAVKFSYFQPNRAFLGALFRHAADPENRLSPFSEATRQIRERDQMYFAQAIAASRDVRVPEDLAGTHADAALALPDGADSFLDLRSLAGATANARAARKEPAAAGERIEDGAVFAAQTAAKEGRGTDRGCGRRVDA